MSLSAQEWLDVLIDMSERNTDVIKNLKSDNPDDIIRWQSLMKEVCPVSRAKNYFGEARYPFGIIITGSDDFQKKMIVDSLFYGLLKFPYFKSIVELDTDFLSDGIESIKDIYERIDMLFSHFYPDTSLDARKLSNALVLYLKISDCEYKKLIADFIVLNILELKSMNYPVFVVCDTEDINSVPAGLKNLFQSFHVSLPNYDERYNYLEYALIKYSMKDRATNDTLTSLTKKTKNFSYKQLSDFALILSLDKNWTDAFIDEAVSSQNFSEPTEALLRRTYESASRFFAEQKAGAGFISQREYNSSPAVNNQTDNTVSSRSESTSSSDKKFYSDSEMAESTKQYRKELEKEVPYKVMDNLLFGLSWEEIELEHT